MAPQVLVILFSAQAGIVPRQVCWQDPADCTGLKQEALLDICG